MKGNQIIQHDVNCAKWSEIAFSGVGAGGT